MPEKIGGILIFVFNWLVQKYKKPLRNRHIALLMIGGLYLIGCEHESKLDDDGPAGDPFAVDGLGQPAVYADSAGLLGGLGAVGRCCDGRGMVRACLGGMGGIRLVDGVRLRFAVPGHGLGFMDQPRWRHAVSGVQDSGHRCIVLDHVAVGLSGRGRIPDPGAVRCAGTGDLGLFPVQGVFLGFL